MRERVKAIIKDINYDPESAFGVGWNEVVEDATTDIMALIDGFYTDNQAKDKEIEKLKKRCLRWREVAEDWYEEYRKASGDEFVIEEQALQHKE